MSGCCLTRHPNLLKFSKSKLERAIDGVALRECLCFKGIPVHDGAS
jgi:hypothetical protein